MYVYIHIPFCNNICKYCDFPKLLYDKKFVNSYLDALEKEIKSRYKKEIVKTIFGTSAVPNNYGSSLSSYLEEFNSALFDLSDSWRVSILQSQKLKAIRKKLIKTDNLNYTGDC